VPSRSHGVVAPELYVDNEGANDRGNPFSFGTLVRHLRGPDYNPTMGSRYSAPADVHNAEVTGAPLEPRMAYGTAYVTPANQWNLSGVASGWSRPYAPNQGAHPRQPVAKLAFGRLGLMGSPPGGDRNVRPPLPTLPEVQRMIQPQL
jgi:hypothetical protein